MSYDFSHPPNSSRAGGRHALAEHALPQSLDYPPPPDRPSPAIWRLVSGGLVVGDYPEAQLLAWVATRQLRPDDLVWRPGLVGYVPIHSVLPFGPYFLGGTNPIYGEALGDSAAIRWLLPVGRSPWAIAAGYLGLFSILGVFAPFAIVAGILGIRQIKRNPQQHGMGRAIFGITAGSFVLVLIAVALVAR